jgi:hypothetical protein
MTAIVLCPGIHPPDLTASFWNAIQSVKLPNALAHEHLDSFIVPHAQQRAFSPVHTLQFLSQSFAISEPLVLIGFSAGVVGMAGAAWAWQQQGSFPIYRLSHDGFTHWSSQVLGMGQDPFYAEPGVSHLDLWRSPNRAWGWWNKEGKRERANAATVVRQILSREY